jgi:hypothetical protein
MKRPQGNILRPPGSKYLNDKKVPAGRKNVMHGVLDCESNLCVPRRNSRACGLTDTLKAAAGLVQRRLSQYEAAKKIPPCGPSQDR